jgi:2-phospho-L-lactate guanylyltransferase
MRPMANASSANLSALHTVVPVRAAADGKSRLGLVLDAEERETLVVGMLVHTLEVLAKWPASRASMVATDDARIAVIARRAQRGVRVTGASGRAGLNAALLAGRQAARMDGATAVLFLPADLPLLSVDALQGLLAAADAAIAAGKGRPVVVVAPSDARNGTNALLLSPVDAIEPAFGENSLEAHVRLTAAADASLQLYVDPVLGFDLDTPDDLLRLDLERLLELQRLGETALSVAGAAASEVA